jgi:hypothetical protein
VSFLVAAENNNNMESSESSSPSSPIQFSRGAASPGREVSLLYYFSTLCTNINKLTAAINTSVFSFRAYTLGEIRALTSA